MRRRKIFKDVLSGCGALEPKLAEKRRCWSLHGHLILDIDWSRFDLRALQEAWNELTTGRGTFGNADTPKVDKRHAAALAKYISKPDWISPEPGTLPPRYLKLLWDGTRYQRLPITWGPAWKERKRENLSKVVMNVSSSGLYL
jgi:hypothetical protein